MIARKKSLVFLLALLAFACQKTATPPDITLQYEIAPQPPRVGAATIDLKLTDKNGVAVSGARVELEGNMSHAGMAPVNGEAKEIETGKYRGTLQLTMAGDWIVLIYITLPDGQKLQRQIELGGVSAEETSLPKKFLSTSSLCNLCVLCASVVNDLFDETTTETQRTQRLHREIRLFV